MDLSVWFAFAAASAALVLIPGPTVTLVVGYAIAQGRSAALAIALGVALGDFVAMSLSLLGMGAVLAASATLFTAVKIVGAAYLAWLGWKLWTAPVGDAGQAAVAPQSSRRMFAHAFAVTALNPKSIIFFVAFVPQFIDRHAAYAPQVAILVATFVTLGLINALAYGIAASGARGLLRRPRVLKAVNRVGGGVLMGAAAAAVAARNAQ
ncbi:MAG: lysine transporter LysE [Rhizobiales bacterium 65-9]|nr:LysE family translocator [Hyphomicrobiales bacterium]OJY38568.1 MAG: lysine transporter LysE [Rhizobiales bacterium 65-9]